MAKQPTIKVDITARTWRVDLDNGRSFCFSAVDSEHEARSRAIAKEYNTKVADLRPYL